MCSECGFEFDACEPENVPATLRTIGGRYRAPLTRSLPTEDLDALLRTRPASGTWSALEYACHTRDVFAVYDGRIARVLAEERPVLPAMDRDRVAVERDYRGQDPALVVDELEQAADRLARRIESVPVSGWARAGVRDGVDISIDWMARNTVHEGTHHLVDVARVLRAARGR